MNRWKEFLQWVEQVQPLYETTEYADHVVIVDMFGKREYITKTNRNWNFVIALFGYGGNSE